MSQQWYAIQTHSGSELTVKRALQRLADEMADGKIAEVLVPTEDLIEVKKGKKSRETFISCICICQNWFRHCFMA